MDGYDQDQAWLRAWMERVEGKLDQLLDSRSRHDVLLCTLRSEVDDHTTRIRRIEDEYVSAGELDRITARPTQVAADRRDVARTWVSVIQVLATLIALLLSIAAVVR